MTWNRRSIRKRICDGKTGGIFIHHQSEIILSDQYPAGQNCMAGDFAGLTGTETVYDLYCGTGSIGIYSGGAAR